MHLIPKIGLCVLFRPMIGPPQITALGVDWSEDTIRACDIIRRNVP